MPTQLEPIAEDAYPDHMAISIDQITDAALALSSEARALLADRLVESLDPLQDEEIQQLWAVEAQRRLDEVRSGRVKPIDGAEALERVHRSVAR